MTCIEVQRNMNAFINDELDGEQLEEFLLHIRTCPSCKEDLEVYYTLFSSIKLLDEDKNINDQMDINKKIRRAEETIRRKKLRILYKRVAMIIFIILVSIMLEK